VAVERPADLALPADFGEGAATRALAQGIREACLESGTLQPRSVTPIPACRVIGDLPGSGVCVDQTPSSALTLQIRCEGAATSAEAIELSRSGCDTAACFAAEASKAGATQLLVVRGAWKDGLAFEGTLTSLGRGSSRPVRPQDFEKGYNPDWPRSGPQVLAILKWFAREVARSELVREEEAAPRIVIPPPPGPPPGAPPQPPSRRWLGMTLIAAGLGAGIAGGIVWERDGQRTGCTSVPDDPDPCRRVQRTIVPALVLAGVGAGALIGGSIVLWRDAKGDPRVAFSVHATGALIGGRF
jgi:hypothetical protein